MNGLGRMLAIALGLTAATACPSREATDPPVAPPEVPVAENIADDAPEELSPAPEAAATPTPSPTPSPTPTPTAAPSHSEPEPNATPSPDRLLSATIAERTCDRIMAKVSDPDPPLNVRSHPDATLDNIVGTLDNGTFLRVEREESGWFQISEPIAGWVAKNRTEYDCGERTARILFPEGGGIATLEGEFVGTGSHRYFFEANAGQTLRIGPADPLPFLIGPSGIELTGGSAASPIWTGTLPETGEYALQFTSDFRGYRYEIPVELQ